MVCSKCGGPREPKQYCKPCRRKVVAASVARWRKKFPERAKAASNKSGREWREKNRQRDNARSLEWYYQNRERALATGAAYRAANPEKVRAKSRRWQHANRDKARYAEQRRRARVKNSIGSFSEAEWNAIVRKQRGRCAMCGERKPLTVDHIVPLSAGGTNFAFNIQALCGRCNRSKGARIHGPAQHSLFDG